MGTMETVLQEMPSMNQLGFVPQYSFGKSGGKP